MRLLIHLSAAGDALIIFPPYLACRFWKISDYPLTQVKGFWEGSSALPCRLKSTRVTLIISEQSKIAGKMRQSVSLALPEPNTATMVIGFDG
jgi:hypothetical protein